MADNFANGLDDLIAQAEADAAAQGEQPVEAAPVAPEPAPEPDPFAHLIGRYDEELDKDPFACLLDDMLAQEGMSKDTETPEHKTASFEEHEWEFKSELQFGGDQVEAICKKCFRQMRMLREHTWTQAMAAHNINPDCGQGVASEVMDS